MKNATFKSFFFLSLSLFLFACSGPIDQGTNEIQEENIILVQEITEGDLPDFDLLSHKKRDVEVYYKANEYLGYSVMYYHDYSGELKGFRAFYGSEESFDKASYEWQDDTTVSITLMGESEDKHISFTLFGNGDTSGIKMDE